jgi:hypothetical protein
VIVAVLTVVGAAVGFISALRRLPKVESSTHKMCELASTANKPQLSGLRLKVKMIRLSLSCSLSCFVYWCGVVRKPESASRFDEFAVHSRVGVFQRRFSGSDPDFLLIVEHDIRVALDQ